MIRDCFTRWRRDLLVATLASLLTGTVLASLAWATLQQERARADAERIQALETARVATQDATHARNQAQRALVDQATDLLANMGGPKKSDAEALQVSTAAVAPEVPQGAYLLIDKKATSYLVGDIIVFRVGLNNFLGRVVRVDKERRHLTVGRNGEADRQITLGEVVGRGALNTR